MAKPRATNSKDGVRRIELRLEPVRVSAEDLAVLITSHELNSIGMTDLNAEEWAGKMDSLSTRELLALAKAEVIDTGIETPHYRVGDSNKMAYSDALKIILERRLFT